MSPSGRPSLKVRALGPQAGVLSYATEGAAGLDIPAAAACTLPPGGWAAIATQLSLEIPPGYEGQVRPRSGLAAKFGVTVLNSPGTIDSDYRGELKVLLINHGPEPFEIRAGDRVAQLVLAPVSQLPIEAVESLSETSRGEGGFGHTGR